MASITPLELAGGAALAAWLFLAVGRRGFWRVREEPVALMAVSASVAVVIPARNEAESIGATVSSLAQQQYSGSVRVYVVDDSSSDDTAAIARSTSPTVTVIAAPPLAPGWTGKLWAVHHGVQAALQTNPCWLLFTDADITHGPESIASLVARAEQGGYDLVSYMVLLHCETFAERALIPAFVFFFFMLYPPASMTGAAGGCILIRPEALTKIGGIEALRGALIDDCTLAGLVRRQGGRLWLGVTRTTRSVRVYPRFRDIEQMIARTAFTQLHYSSLLLLGTIAGMALLYLVPVWLAVTGHWLGWATLALMALLFLPTIRFYRLAWLWVFTLPAIALFYMAATVHSAWLHWRGRGGQWKGRVQG